MKYFIQTFGCQMNYSDSERVAAVLQNLRYDPAESAEKSDLIILNTCSIRQKGEDRVFGLLKNLAGYRKANPNLLIGLTGCMVRITSTKNSDSTQKDKLLKMRNSKLDFVFKITDTNMLPDILAQAEAKLELPELEEIENSLAEEQEITKPAPVQTVVSAQLSSPNRIDYLKVQPEYTTKFQAYVPIQIGCDKYCTYCIVPYSRGREQSRPMSEILEECTKLVEQGCKEITLVGQTVNSYGLSALDKQKGLFLDSATLPFVQLLTKIDQLRTKGLARIRYTSPHPKDLSDQLIEAHATLKTLCNHLHLPVQSGDNEVLRRMNRKYSVEEYLEKVEKLKTAVPDMALTTDVIVGFCGETDEQFANTRRLFEKLRFDQVYIARYSPRSGTVSDSYFPDDVPKEIKAERWHTLNNLLTDISRENNNRYVGKTLEILVERYNSNTQEVEGRSREYKLVQFAGEQELTGRLISVRVTSSLDWVLKGEILKV